MAEEFKREPTKEELKEKLAELSRETPLRRENEGSQESPEHLLHELQVHQIELELQNEEMREAQQELEVSRSRYADLYDFAPVAYFLLDRQGTIVDANLTAAQLLNYPRNRLPGRSFLLQVKQPDQDVVRGLLDKCASSGIEVRADVEMNSKSGFRLPVNLILKPARNALGKGELFQAAVVDISERKEAEDLLRDSEARYRAIFENTGTSVCVVDMQGLIISMNQQFERLSGYEAAEVLGKRYLQEMLPAGLANFLRDRTEMLMRRRDNVVDFEASFVTRKGKTLDTIMMMSLMPGQRNFIVAVVDVTKEKEFARNLAEANERLSEFLSVAAHELSLPATVIKGYAQTLQTHEESMERGEVDELLGQISSYSDRLSQLVEELLDASRISARRFTITPRPVQLAQVLDEFRQEMEFRNYAAEFAYALHATDTPVELDPERLRQVLGILVDNAVKFSRLSAQVEVDLEERERELQVTVADRGPGIPEVLRTKIFDRFFQVADVEHHSIPGLGLGLFIAREIVEAQGGLIWHEPRPGGGSIFRFRIPLPPLPAGN